MSLNLLYSFREGIAGFRRARLATTITVSTIAVTMMLLGVFLILTVNVQSIAQKIREKISLEIFIDSSLNTKSVQDLESTLMQIEGVKSVVFISKEEALERFKNEFGDDPLVILGDNPLPPSFQVQLKQAFRYPEGVEAVVKEAEVLEGVDQVVYHGKLFKAIDRYSRIVLLVDVSLFLTVLLAAVLLVANTLRLTILSQSKTIQTMELVGATRSFIRRPYLIQGVLQGGIGGGIGAVVVWVLVKIVNLRFPHFLIVSPTMILLPLVLGILLGFLGGSVGLRRFLRTS